MPERRRVIVDFAEHAGDVYITLVEGADGAYSCESTTKLFEDGRFGVGFEAFDFAGAGEVDACDLDADC